MSIPALFIRRPVATALLAAGLALAGATAYFLLPVSPLPNIDVPTISVSASMAGASPEVMAATVATPLERHLGAIADVNEMTSSSTVGSSRITLQFDIKRDINGAARDVQAAINAAAADLPASLHSNPTYRKVNPADMPMMILAMTSKSLTPGQIYDQASNIVLQRLSQVSGVGDVELNGASLPAVRVELNPRALFKYGIGLEDVRAALAATNAHSPKGEVSQFGQDFEVNANDSAIQATQYKNLIVAYRNGAAVRLEDVADVQDGVENIRNIGVANGQPAVLVTVTKMPGANVIQVADQLRKLVPQLQASLPPSILLSVVNDSTIPIRAALGDVEITLVIAIGLVILIVFLFLRNAKAAIIPSLAVPLSLLGTFGGMYLMGYSLDNFSLMALIISTGFVIDDAIVVLENVTRHIEAGEAPLQAAFHGSQEVAFTVLSMSISLIAVFFPILLMGGIVGRLFHEFAMTLTVAILVSLVVSLTVTPMICAHLAFSPDEHDDNFVFRASRRAFEAAHDFYARTLGWVLDNPLTVVAILAITIGLNFYLFTIIPKGFFPIQDEGRMQGGLRADQSISFQSMQKKFMQFVKVLDADPAVATVGGFAGSSGASNSGNLFVTLKPPSQRSYVTTNQVIDRLRPRLAGIAGARLFLQAAQQVRAGGRQSFSSYQYTIQADSLDELNQWVPKITKALQEVPELEDINSDQQDKGLEVDLKLDRQTASRLGLATSQIDNTLYDAFGQRTVSTIYKDKNQYYVVMEVAPAFWQSPETLRDIYVSTSAGAVSGTQSTNAVTGTVTAASAAAATTPTPSGIQSVSSAAANTSAINNSALTGAASAAAATSSTAPDTATIQAQSAENAQLNALTSTHGGSSSGASVATSTETMVPLSAFTTFGPGTTPLAISHQGPFVATTFSFNLPDGESLGDATTAIQRTMAHLNVPISVHGDFAGTANLYRASLANEPILILAAIIAIYIVLGVLYESYVHPLTILSTLPSAGVGAVMALLIFRMEFSLIALIGVILLIGIVKKNAIMMIDFAIEAQRQGRSAHEAIHHACMLRFRPIMMTTLAAIMGGIPLAAGIGQGSELRQPLGVSVVGGLLLSQVLTLYTTPVIYLYLERWRVWVAAGWRRWYHLPKSTQGGQARGEGAA
jgi:multidrug efflux pump